MEWRTSTYCILLLALIGIQVDSKNVSPSNHVNNICSMWGNFHFKTFDGDVYQFPGMCEYNLVSDCQGLIRQFSVHVKRTEHTNGPKISRVSVSINDIAVELTENQAVINGQKATLPVHVSGILVEENTIYTRLYSKMGITVTWNKEDAVMVELDSKYSNRTCGLCGDFNGVPVYSEFIESGRRVGYTEFGNKHRVPNPTHDCEDPFENIDEQNEVDQCEKYRADCADLLEDEKWSSCSWVLNTEPYIKACTNDICSREPEDEDTTALCATLSEYSRQCSHAGGTPPTWRTAKFCAVTCPYNMVHSESGSPCMDTCSHRDTNTLCEEHNIDGCFCPPGTVFDDISNTGCIPAENCQCKHDRAYNTGEVLRKDEEECICEEGKWICESIPGPGLCAVEEGSHFTTFDGKEFTFHGDCNYVLSKDCDESKFIILGLIVPCFTHETDTCLKSVVVLFDNDKKNPLIIKADGTVQHNAEVSLPYMTADFTVFMPSSFHIMLQTSFGLQVQVQLVPLMQVYITVDQSFQGKTCGLCGNFNKVLTDDLKTPQGVVEGTAASFANAWKALSNCPDRTERMDDPCSYSSDSEHFAEHWCSKMKDKESLFAKCHTTVNPDSYYKRCKYSSCTCEKSEDCLCTVFSSYARACAAKGIFLQGWREIVCEKYTENCPASQNYSYQLQSCQRTCLSLASERQSCSADFVPVDGCACPEGLYQDENELCVPMEKCPCYHNGQKIHPGKSVTIRDEHCVCMNGKFHCRSWKTRILGCSSPKVFFNCSTAGPDEHGLECAQTCMQQEVDCFSVDCQSGCQCPLGLLDDGRGHCVKSGNCPCKHDGQFYAPGSEITKDCNKCICQWGKWKCTHYKCPGICTIYGSGHYITFDQQRFGFRGDCSYIAAQNKCGNKTGNFHVITENMPCGTTGTTCSKAVGILLGRTWLLLSDGTVKATDMGSGPEIKYNERNVGMYLVIDANNGLTILWDRKTTVRIILQPQHMGDICGLCGNFNGNGKDDFTTQGNLPTTDVLEFVDSWKVLSTCPDAKPDFNPCLETPNRETWAKIQCSIIKEVTFKDCHNKVDPNPYYENCVKDSCSCDAGGDCECFCTAVAAYAQACNEAGVCVVWRTPEICPVYCDFYNKHGECTWHYSPCHTPCYKTCLNPDGICNNTLPNLEGFCEGWGDPHYITFDGLFYSYQGNCTYILMEEIRPHYHLKIYIDNVYCDPIEHVSCPRSIIVSYNKQVITLKNHNLIGGADLEVIKDDVKLNLPYAFNGVRVISSSLDLFLSIPQLGVDITFGATGFSINLPFQHFGNNTQGHCGTCNNNQGDDCMLPGGILVDDCAVMADYWPASGVNGEMCTPPTALPTVGGDIKPTTKPCQAHPDCNLLSSEPEQNTITVPTEGCFCPEGTLLFNKETEVCVNKCGCLDSSGTPREFDEVFEYNCEECICDKASKSVICKPKKCSDVNPESCTEPGFVLINVTNPSDPCCSKQVCDCNVNMCPPLDKQCAVGYAPVLEVPNGKCCPEIKCEPKKVCVHKNIEYEPGTDIPVVNCQECSCTWDVDPKTQLFKIKCGFVQCNEECDPGYKYVETSLDDCCGKCVQTHCIVNINGFNQILPEGATLPIPNQGCDKVTCTKVNGQFIANKHTVQCPPFNISNCQPGTVQVTADGCCYVCVDQIKGCQIQTVHDYINHNDCQSEKKMDLTFCGGDCTSFRRYTEPGLSSCSCCQAKRSSNRTVNLDCVNGDVITHSYIHVEECSCSRTNCHEMGASLTLTENDERKRSFGLP
ncbi:Mucin-2 [Anabarilius grahami]|uniref:Mucin-2 n=1 Tax=Anabarilius grahami TaxID=495550 RepID=A0A3N0Z8D9_ANAGA|nr:Mucin-2 [Anabarilius grahami]